MKSIFNSCYISICCIYTVYSVWQYFCGNMAKGINCSPRNFSRQQIEVFISMGGPQNSTYELVAYICLDNRSWKLNSDWSQLYLKIPPSSEVKCALWGASPAHLIPFATLGWRTWYLLPCYFWRASLRACCIYSSSNSSTNILNTIDILCHCKI